MVSMRTGRVWTDTMAYRHLQPVYLTVLVLLRQLADIILLLRESSPQRRRWLWERWLQV
jgi:hypothetical protein